MVVFPVHVPTCLVNFYKVDRWKKKFKHQHIKYEEMVIAGVHALTGPDCLWEIWNESGVRFRRYTDLYMYRYTDLCNMQVMKFRRLICRALSQISI